MLEQIIERIENERLKRGMSKKFLCNKAGISVVQFLNLINGQNTRVSTIESLLKALDIKKLNIKL